MLSRVLPYPPQRSFMAYHSWKPNTELAPNCPRCDSSNTKFCYYNNYSLTQPRYFCKGCRRYWTKGGTLRNVPVGGGCRKNRRGKSARPQANHPTSHSDLSYDSHRSSDAQHDGMRGISSHHSNNSDLPPPSEGSTTIDLAQIYTKFVNQSPELNSDPVLSEVPGEIMDDSFSVMGAGEPNSGMNQLMAGQGSNQLGGREISEALFENYQTYTEDSNFSLDPGSSESVAFSSEGVVTGNDIPVSDSWRVAPPPCPGFQPLLEDDMFHHQDLVIGDWYLLDQFYNLDY